MLFNTPTLLYAALLAARALAGPILLAERQECPAPTITTTSVYAGYTDTTLRLATTTVTNGISELGSVTSTQTLRDTRTITSWKTKYSPATTTIPATTVTASVNGDTLTIAWFTTTSTSTLSGTPPASLCQTKTCTKFIDDTFTWTYTQELWYDTTWLYTTGHVSTKTSVILKTTTKTITTPGTTVARSTATTTVTLRGVAITDTTIWTTVYATPAPTVCT